MTTGRGLLAGSAVGSALAAWYARTGTGDVRSVRRKNFRVSYRFLRTRMVRHGSRYDLINTKRESVRPLPDVQLPKIGHREQIARRAAPGIITLLHPLRKLARKNSQRGAKSRLAIRPRPGVISS
jgi:hypothetical protein